MQENKLEECHCKRVCKRHGLCSECIEHHKTLKYAPFCQRVKKKQKTSTTSPNRKEEE